MRESLRPPKHQPPGTRSQMVRYLDANGFEVARVHQYLRPNGKLGGSGRPNPKRLVVNGIVYAVLSDTH